MTTPDPERTSHPPLEAPDTFQVNLTVNGTARTVDVDPRTTLLTLLRERFDLTGTKAGCHQGTCGACTVHVDGRRALSCLILTVSADDAEIRTIEDLAEPDGTLHPMQRAFVEFDALQCGFCTPGQIMSAEACVREGNAESDDDVREYMSGNLCRCSAYPNIVRAVRSVAESR
ncbi:(2Fe-2S)-binding protein [Herbidospora mongoliensis]|uniref:(2Fe-2S)-binding protein n=1 Tax=Herbidospora mongoliensis TaxID=688067 RepID=UPI000A050C83|nr:(2Fe-2S)-binding protein [Herbidospora mongoliensis]